jgi:hypothetical protein
MEKQPVKISVGESFRTIADACNKAFGTKYKGVQKSYFMPKPLRDKYDVTYIAWFPKEVIAGNEPATNTGWMNRITHEGNIEEWNEYNPESTTDFSPELKLDSMRITFMKLQFEQRYKFLGVFKFSDELSCDKRIWEKVSDDFPMD